MTNDRATEGIKMPKKLLKETSSEGGIAQHFGDNLAKLLATKFLEVYPSFPSDEYIKAIKKNCPGQSYTQRVDLHVQELHRLLPTNFKVAVKLITSILGPENKEQTGMFKVYYWILPLGKYIETYGLNHFKESIHALEEITKRNTAEYAIRAFIRKYPQECLEVMESWAKSDNFHLRRLSSEGLRPKLPWASKLDTFIENPKPVFRILNLLREDSVLFVKKSVANHLTDWLKVNPEPTKKLIHTWRKSKNPHTEWILKRATRKFDIKD